MPLNAPPSLYDQSGPTRNGPAGSWIACDESGWDGENLVGSGPSRYLVYAAVAIDDVEAQTVLDQLRREARIKAPEVKFDVFKRREWRHESLHRVLGPGGALDGRGWALIFDKEYAAAAKIIDLLLEEKEAAAGGDLHINHQARRMARIIAMDGPRALGADRFKRLMVAFVRYASRRGRESEPAREEFFDQVEEAWASSTRRNVTEILMKIRAARHEAVGLLANQTEHPLLELLMSCVAQAARWGGARLGKVNVLTDGQNALSDVVMADVAEVVRNGWGPTPSTRQRRVDLPSLVRGDSTLHPSIQLADLLAGAVRVAAEDRAGDSPSDFGTKLWPTVLPYLDEQSADPSPRR